MNDKTLDRNNLKKMGTHWVGGWQELHLHKIYVKQMQKNMKKFTPQLPHQNERPAKSNNQHRPGCVTH